jgi:hypothetical protein
MSPAVTIPFVRTVPTGIFEIVIFVLFSVANMEAKFNKLGIEKWISHCP